MGIHIYIERKHKINVTTIALLAKIFCYFMKYYVFICSIYMVKNII